jgi:hypothetical protein
MINEPDGEFKVVRRTAVELIYARDSRRSDLSHKRVRETLETGALSISILRQ